MKGTMVEAGTGMFSLAITLMSLFPNIKLTFWCKLEGMASAECIHGQPKSRLKTVRIFTTMKDTSNHIGLSGS